MRITLKVGTAERRWLWDLSNAHMRQAGVNFWGHAIVPVPLHPGFNHAVSMVQVEGGFRIQNSWGRQWYPRAVDIASPEAQPAGEKC
jgi:hypothetical protein